MAVTLQNLLPNTEARIIDFRDPLAGQLLMSMGLLPGDNVLLERVAPLNGPMIFRSGQLTICMRPEEAATVLCELVSNTEV